MAELLKNLYTPEFIDKIGKEISKHYPSFDCHNFRHAVLDEGWSTRELKQRMRHITHCLHAFLPENYPDALQILKLTAPYGSGFLYMFFPDFVEVYGMENEEESLEALELFTQYSSSEFAIRPFLKRNPKRVIKKMNEWSLHQNHHVRRLASEGCRPRLPWAMALPALKKDPHPILPILENLKEDPSEYVRRSVANNLNDIAKDNPKIVLKIADQWLGTSKETDWIVKHASRTLLKKGNPEALAKFAFVRPIGLEISSLNLSTTRIKEGETLSFSFQISNASNEQVKLRIEYGIYFMKSNGKANRKVFKIGEGVYKDRILTFSKKHAFKPLTTRKHYAGLHKLTIIINGTELAEKDFLLE